VRSVVKRLRRLSQSAMAELDTAPAPSAGSSTLGRRVQMYSLMMLSIAVCKIIRFSLPSVVPAMATALGYSTTDTAAVLAAFFPGYLISQVPAGPIVQKWGGKALNTLNLGGSALCMALVPLAARSSRLLVSIVFLVMGLCQGPSIPVLGQLNQEWAPPGIERGWALRAQGLAHSLAPAIAAGITPVIIKRGGGWQNVFNGYAVGAAVATVAWQLCAANSPAGERKKTEPKAQTGATKTPSLSSTQQQGTVTVPKAPAVAAQKVVEYRIFSLPAVQVLCVHCFCANNLNQVQRKRLLGAIF
jgi:sugar phosphate permease